MKRTFSGLAVLALANVTACKPPPTDDALTRDAPDAEVSTASKPLPSPDTEGALWTPSAEEGRIIYGIPGEPALAALACRETGVMRISRLAPADEGASALLALIGNGAIGRIEVEAVEVSGRIIWQGDLAADDDAWEPLAGPRQMTITVPGAGIVQLNPSPLPEQFLSRCRSSVRSDEPDPPANQG
ncbi:hypothetical protein [Erythrobacter sp. MTPC3]|uniref:hypothetical protein n=1 Tax=Erythrobacter sp. MTPC3 TaxID=3056564 RepID=UPI0036F202AD